MKLYVDIKKRFGEFNLDVKIDLKKGITALLGASGSGKSMTLKCIAGLEKPDSGQIIVDDTVLFDSKKSINLPPQKRKIGMLFQNYALFPNMTVKENIAIVIKDKKQRDSIVKDILKKFCIEDLENHYPYQLSGGQSQRVAIARIIASSPEIIMLDEPFSALDSYLKWRLEQEILKYLKDFDKTTIFVSHNRDEVYRVCDDIAVISNGKLNGTTDKWELYSNPKTYSEALLTGCKNISEAEIISDKEYFALDWGLKFENLSENQENIKWIGIRANKFLNIISDNEEDYYSFEYDIIYKMEDTFSYIYMIKPKGVEVKSLIRWEISRNNGDFLFSNKLYINKSDVLLLT